MSERDYLNRVVRFNDVNHHVRKAAEANFPNLDASIRHLLDSETMGIFFELRERCPDLIEESVRLCGCVLLEIPVARGPNIVSRFRSNDDPSQSLESRRS